jgi:hypothetical protein
MRNDKGMLPLVNKGCHVLIRQQGEQDVRGLLTMRIRLDKTRGRF